jgi:hypothetical protein
MKNIVDISHCSSRTFDEYYFDVTLDAEEITLPGGEVTIDGESYEGTLTVRGGKHERDEEITILFDDDDLDDELLDKLEQLVLDQFYRLDTNNN